MPDPRKCIVKFRDRDGVEHSTHVTAASLYEAALVALGQFRRDDWSREAAFEMGTLQVEVWEPPTVHKISIATVERWLQRAGGSPREVALRHRIRERLQTGKEPRK